MDYTVTFIFVIYNRLMKNWAMIAFFQKKIMQKCQKKSDENANAIAGMHFWDFFFVEKVVCICELPQNPCGEK